MRSVAKLVCGVAAIAIAVVVIAGGKLFGLSAVEEVAFAAGLAGAAALL